ncbi:MAG TPA: hypothetical protein DCR14_01710, partial [Acidimicrobiaceae bacterium]|nr:hypothetical protein [Acidimicrobiaceae bacterium]
MRCASSSEHAVATRAIARVARSGTAGRIALSFPAAGRQTRAPCVAWRGCEPNAPRYGARVRPLGRPSRGRSRPSNYRWRHVAPCRWRWRVLAAVRSATVFGVEGRAITVEVHVSTGLPSFQIVGLPDEACRESRDRVRAAVLSSGLAWPSCRVTVNLAPSGQRKGGSGLDLPIAIGFLAANGQVPVESLEGLGFVGELGLDGSLRGVPGIAPMVAAMQPCRPVVPMAGFREAQGVVGEGARVGGSLRAVVDALNADEPWPMPPDDELLDDDPPVPDLADVRGQAMARLGVEIAAAGGD